MKELYTSIKDIRVIYGKFNFYNVEPPETLMIKFSADIDYGICCHWGLNLVIHVLVDIQLNSGSIKLTFRDKEKIQEFICLRISKGFSMKIAKAIDLFNKCETMDVIEKGICSKLFEIVTHRQQ